DNGNNNQGGTGGNGQGGDTQQQSTVKPEIKTDVKLSGKLSGIYDASETDRKDTNTLITNDVKTNPENYFTNGDQIKDAIKDATVTVDGGFKKESSWSGNPYSTWSTGTTATLYPSAAPQINIASLNDLKDTKLKDSTAIETFLKDANISFTGASGFSVQNQPGLTDGDLLHINIKAKQNSQDLNLDLQIPVSNINLETTLKISIDATTNTTGNKIEAVKDLGTKFSYNIGIDATLKFEQQKGEAPAATTNEVSDAATAAKNILVKLGYVSSGDTLSDDKISAALGIYNCKFTPKSATENTNAKPNAEVTNSNKVYTVTVTATPYNETYVWDDGSTGPKDISFDVSLKVS
ncbi:hypothetical protein D8X55_02505, partial [Malacoplasma penetrans]|uniref:P35 family lipoprotein n=1 Tax=Malacoplasma penetrans TaxID=28227 RepID=UPI001012BFD0